ncbi:Uncharacterized protein dnl_00050 [Desulfonema limicola]|uniref:Uncharacterized protein n=1 Tax=Desulfonema limicola TaxID=45656 RepID=A0A975B2U9_9BACT|nr:Uncharacterized protein dnl_00020 [Desulfonema limicola]QTA77808.1 Uncharacterized protein dnl_00050 [Desulfonema limicola]
MQNHHSFSFVLMNEVTEYDDVTYFIWLEMSKKFVWLVIR